MFFAKFCGAVAMLRDESLDTDEVPPKFTDADNDVDKTAAMANVQQNLGASKVLLHIMA